jgi:hypothetical protein
MFLMTDAAQEYLGSSKGWEVGVGPSLVVIEDGIAKTLTTTITRDDVQPVVPGYLMLRSLRGIKSCVWWAGASRVQNVP